MLNHVKALSVLGLAGALSLYASAAWAVIQDHVQVPEAASKQKSAKVVTPAKKDSAANTVSPALIPKASESVSASSWNARDGQTLRHVVEGWAGREGWKVQWLADDLNYAVVGNFGFDGTFHYAIARLAYTYATVERPLLFEFWNANRILVISEKK